MENLSVQAEKNGSSNTNSRAASPSPATPARPSAAGTNGLKEQDSGTPLTPEDKKRRALQKKLGAIEALKAKRDSGEKLEKTQEKKIEAEAEVRKELAEIGA
jgi:translation initiation factor 2A